MAKFFGIFSGIGLQFDVELCDCFLEYGETTAEMALLFTFVLFGTSDLDWPPNFEFENSDL
jgi:hypothetical protein